jgi:hypothetical protein
VDCSAANTSQNPKDPVGAENPGASFRVDPTDPLPTPSALDGEQILVVAESVLPQSEAVSCPGGSGV